MNNLTEQRNNKFLNKVKEAGDLGYFDHELAEMLGWTITTVRSTASCVQAQDRVNVISTDQGWYICNLEDDVNDKRRKTGSET